MRFISPSRAPTDFRVGIFYLYRPGVAMNEQQESNKCTWSENFDPDFWDSACGETFTLLAGTLQDNHMRFCPFCGREIIEVKTNVRE